MRRPTRTRRLSIAALLSLLAFVLAVLAGVRSLWVGDGWAGGGRQAIELIGGRVIYTWTSVQGFVPTGHFSSSVHPADRKLEDVVWGWDVEKHIYYPVAPKANSIAQVKRTTVAIPILPLLILLLVIPERWCKARPASSLSFTVMTGAVGAQPDQNPTLEYRKRDLKPAPIWVIAVMGVLSGIGGCAMGGIAILVFALFHPGPLQQYDSVKNDLTLTAIGICGGFASLAVFVLTWGRRFR